MPRCRHFISESLFTFRAILCFYDCYVSPITPLTMIFRRFHAACYSFVILVSRLHYFSAIYCCFHIVTAVIYSPRFAYAAAHAILLLFLDAR